MPADFIIDPDRKMVFSKATGAVDAAVIFDHMDRLLQHEDFNPACNQLFDLRGITNLELTTDDIKKLAGRTVFNANSKRAFVVSSELHFGFARMFGSYRDFHGERGIVVFRDIKEARDWLALPHLEPV